MPLIQLQIHSEPLHELSIATTFPHSIYAQIHQHPLMCTAVRVHSVFSPLSLKHYAHQQRQGYLWKKFLHSIFSSFASCVFSSLSFLLLIIEKGSAYYFLIKKKEIDACYVPILISFSSKTWRENGWVYVFYFPRTSSFSPFPFSFPSDFKPLYGAHESLQP